MNIIRRQRILFRQNMGRACWRGLSGASEGAPVKPPFDSFIATDVDSIYTSSQLDGDLSMTLDNFKVSNTSLIGLSACLFVCLRVHACLSVITV